MRQQWQDNELIESSTLEPEGLELIRNKTGKTRLGFAVLLKFFELEARFPPSQPSSPSRDITGVANNSSNHQHLSDSIVSLVQ